MTDEESFCNPLYELSRKYPHIFDGFKWRGIGRDEITYIEDQFEQDQQIGNDDRKDAADKIHFLLGIMGDQTFDCLKKPKLQSEKKVPDMYELLINNLYDELYPDKKGRPRGTGCDSVKSAIKFANEMKHRSIELMNESMSQRDINYPNNIQKYIQLDKEHLKHRFEAIRYGQISHVLSEYDKYQCQA